jgi:hypothetical protein
LDWCQEHSATRFERHKIVPLIIPKMYERAVECELRVDGSDAPRHDRMVVSVPAVSYMMLL